MPQRSLELYDLAKKLTELSDAELCRQMGLSRSALGVQRNRGSLTPSTAERLARLLRLPDDEIAHWIALSAMELNRPGKTGYRRMR